MPLADASSAPVSSTSTSMPSQERNDSHDASASLRPLRASRSASVHTCAPASLRQLNVPLDRPILFL
jgi:hypothetical protein